MLLQETEIRNKNDSVATDGRPYRIFPWAKHVMLKYKYYGSLMNYIKQY